MGIEVRVAPAGRRDLWAVRQRLRDIGNRGLGQQMGQALGRAARPVKPAVQASAAEVLPSGYGPLMSRSVRTRTTSRERRGAASVSITVYAAGKKEHRDVSRVNKGALRHPVWGRRRKPWVTQQVRRGFVDRPVGRLAPGVMREMRQVVDWVGDQIARG